MHPSRTSPTLSDIARSANVSKSTVSRVLNGKSVVNSATRQTVLETMKMLGYSPNISAQSLASGRSLTVGVLTQKIGSPFYDAILQGVIEGLRDTAYCPLFADGQWEAEAARKAVQTLLGRQVDGLILLGCDLGEEAMTALCDQVPVMVVARKVIGLEHQCVAVDNREAAREAVEHLISFGHRRIATITGLGDHPDAVDRLAGYHDALRDAGIEIDNGLVCGGDFSAQSGVLAINSLLMRGIHFSAVFCANDATAIGAQLALYRHGIRVPNDISLVGFDDQGEAAFLTPPLTTVRQPAVEMGQAAATALIRLMQEEPASVPPMKACLIARETVSRISR